MGEGKEGDGEEEKKEGVGKEKMMKGGWKKWKESKRVLEKERRRE